MSDDKLIVQSSKLKTIFTIIGFLTLITALVGLAWFVKSMYDTNLQLRSEIIEQKNLTKTLIRASNRWVTKKDLKENLKGVLTAKDRVALEKDLRKLNAKLVAVGKTIGTVEGKITSLEKSDKEGKENKVEKCEDGRIVDVHGYTKHEQIKELKDSNNAPVAKVKFNAAERKPWSYEIYKRNYYITTVVGRKSSGQLTFHHTLKYRIFDKSYPVSLMSSKYVQLPRSNGFFWWNPKLDLGVFGGGVVYGGGDLFSFGGEFGFSLSSYGATKVDSIWRFFRFGIGYDAERHTARFSLAPVMFNLGRTLPLLTNLYIIPQLGFDTDGGLSVGLGFGVQL